MDNKQILSKFINNVARNDLKKADQQLAAIVNEKIKQRIQAADKKLSTQDK